MKYLSLIFVLMMMCVTWRWTQDDQTMTEQVHVSLQEHLKKMISDYIQQKLPNSRNLHYQRFWTEPLSENKIKAAFIYTFEDVSDQTGQAQVQIEGFAILNRVLSSVAPTQKDPSPLSQDSMNWSLDDLVIVNNNIEYRDPLAIVGPRSSDQNSVGDDVEAEGKRPSDGTETPHETSGETNDE